MIPAGKRTSAVQKPANEKDIPETIHDDLPPCGYGEDRCEHHKTPEGFCNMPEGSACPMEETTLNELDKAGDEGEPQ